MTFTNEQLDRQRHANEVHELQRDIDEANQLLEKATRLVELYEWIFENGLSVCRNATMREDDQVWVAYDVDGDLVARGRDAEEAAWGARDRAEQEGNSDD